MIIQKNISQTNTMKGAIYVRVCLSTVYSFSKLKQKTLGC